MANTVDILRGFNALVGKRANADTGILSSGGAMPVEVEKEFLRIAQNATPLLTTCRMVTMGAPTKKIPKLIFEDDVLRADPGEGVALASGVLAVPTASEVSLVSKKVMAEVDITDELFEDNVEGDSLEATIMEMLAERVGVNVEKMALMSDTAIVDPTLVANGMAQQNGWLKLVTSNTVAFSSADLTRAKMNALLVSIALKYRQKAKHQYFVEEYAGEVWRDIIGDRATAAGDAAVTGGEIPRCNGKTVQQVGNMPVTSGSPNISSILLTDPKNLIIGWQRGVTLELERKASQCLTKVVVSMRLAFAVEHQAAAAKGTSVKAR